MPLDVIWHEPKNSLFASEGTHGRRRYYATAMLNDMLDTYSCRHHVNYTDGMPNVPGAVVIFHGGHEKDLVDQINRDVAALGWVIFIGMGDEESEFPYARLSHPNSKLWIQSPIPGIHKADRFHLFGYAPKAHEFILSGLVRTYDWFFSGQITHDRRREMAAQLRKMSNGRLIETEGFGQGIAPSEYFAIMSCSKVIPCPTGPACPDSFRFAEALEAGCIPIVDSIPTWKAATYPYGFWELMFPQGMPFPIVKNWNELPETMYRLIKDFDFKRQEVANWWSAYKRDYYSWLGQDLIALGAA